MNWLLTSNDLAPRMLRTIIEAGLAFVLANLAAILSGFPGLAENPMAVAGLTAVLTAVLSPALASIKTADDRNDEVI